MIPFESKLQHIKNLEERNRVFDSLSYGEKRKEIAYDLLLLVIKGKVKPNDCGYWCDELLDISTKTAKEFQVVLNKKLPTCEVCARGGMMLSRIRLGNKISSEYFNKDGNDNIRHNEKIQVFSLGSFQQMESEYEMSMYNHPYVSHSKNKLMNICCNVIVNGDFSINDGTDYLVGYNIR